MIKSGSFEFFEDYSSSIQKIQPELYQEIRRILNDEFKLFYNKNKRKPIILDIGSAGVLPYDTKLVENVIILDLFDKPKNIILKENCQWIVGDVLSNQVIQISQEIERKFDFIIMSSLLHHLCDENNNILKNLKLSFAHSKLLLSKSGKICIFESVCPKFLSKIEDLIYPIYSKILLKVLKFTYVRMVSVYEIIECLDHVKLKSEIIPFRQPRYIAQMYWKVPTSIYPLKIQAIFAYN